MEPGGAKHPNRLRELRMAAALSREDLAASTSAMAEENPVTYSSVSPRSLERLERGEVRPRRRVAAALARVVGAAVEDVFPLGMTDPNRNPQGTTRIAEGRPSPGRPRKIT